MRKNRIIPQLDKIPQLFHPLLTGSAVFDSSCSATAQVLRIERGQGLYLKSAAKTSLAQEAAMTGYFHNKGLGPEVLEYISEDQDWLLTAAVPGDDCIASEYLDQPNRLAETLGSLLRMLHEQDHGGCPIADLSTARLSAAADCYRNRLYDEGLFPDNWGYATAEEAWAEIDLNGQYLQCDTLIHGDYCLPNVILDHWHFSGFIDLGGAGISDRHFDLFWGMWSLGFNLKTDRYLQRFLDAYGREAINEEILRLVAAIEVFS